MCGPGAASLGALTLSGVEFQTYQFNLGNDMKKCVLAAVMALAAGGAFAQVYVGGSYSSMKLDVDCDALDSCEKNSSGYKAIVGYQINPLIAIEAGYLKLGHGVGVTPDTGSGSAAGTISSTAYYVGGAVRQDFRWGFGGVARLGLASVKSEFAGHGLDGFPLSASDRSIRPVFGLGVEYALAPHMKITADLDFTRTAEIDSIPDDYSGTIRALSIGARFLF